MFYLTSAIVVRIGKNKETVQLGMNKDILKQWIIHQFYIGAEHIYLYDNYKTSDEKLESFIKNNFNSEKITYIDWNSNEHPKRVYKNQQPPPGQVDAYNHCIKKWGDETVWQMSFDMDEFPLIKNDLEENYLSRWLQNMENKYPEFVQYCLPNCIFTSEWISSEKHIFKRCIKRDIKELSSYEWKTLYKPKYVENKLVHVAYIKGETDKIRKKYSWCDGNNLLIRGKTAEIMNPNIIRFNHYKGPRLDCQSIETVEDKIIISLITKINSFTANSDILKVPKIKFREIYF